LQELGYVEGRTAVIEWRWWEGKPERLRDAVAEMVRLNLDVIVVGGSEATKAMKEATRSIPIVFVGPSYPVEEGLVRSFARPGGNITGVTVAQSDTVTKLLQLLRMSSRHSPTSASSGARPTLAPSSPSGTWKRRPRA
jgi:putative ABC transport system substrate-binding protein